MTTTMYIPPTLQWPVNFCIASALVIYVISVVTGNVSQIDRVWTFMPFIYTAYFALLPLWPRNAPFPLCPYTPDEVTFTGSSPRVLLMLGLLTIWMIRLSYIAWRRGLFNPSEEDYRWNVLRQKMSPFLFQIFNLVFIAIFQSIILFIFGIPAYFAVHQPHMPLVTSDIILANLVLVNLAFEFVADNQQYSYQTYKYSGVHLKDDWIGSRIRWTPADAKRGFVTRGLWAWSRHPNFLCEQLFWILMTLFPLLAPGAPTFPSLPLTIAQFFPLVPIITTCSLFFSSTQFSESISSGKYPAYAAYQRRVAMFIPLFTPLWGLLLLVKGEKKEVDKLVYGDSEDAIKGGKTQ